MLLQLSWQSPICADMQDMDRDLTGSNLAETMGEVNFG